MLVKKLTKSSLLIYAPAKINLFLQVLNKREDNFHNINSLFQAISIYDELQFEQVEEAGCKINVINNSKLTVGDDNLISKAYNLLMKKYDFHGGLQVSLTKNIPLTAGLAGGSTDGAATMIACNLLFNLELTNSELAQLSSHIGSDLPFFFSNGQALVTGRGELIEEQSLPLNYFIVLINPGFELSTPAAYDSLERGLTSSGNRFNLGSCQTVAGLVARLNQTGNDFEEVHFKSFPELERIKNELLGAGALMARMSGSGPTMFGLFENSPDIDQIKSRFPGNWFVFTVKPIAIPVSVL